MILFIENIVTQVTAVFLGDILEIFYLLIDFHSNNLILPDRVPVPLSVLCQKKVI